MLLPLGRRLPRGLLLFASAVRAARRGHPGLLRGLPLQHDALAAADRHPSGRRGGGAGLRVRPPPKGRRPERLAVDRAAGRALLGGAGGRAAPDGVSAGVAGRGPGLGLRPPAVSLSGRRRTATSGAWPRACRGACRCPRAGAPTRCSTGSRSSSSPARSTPGTRRGCRVVWAVEAAGDLGPTVCRGPRVGVFAIEAECDLLPLFADCAPGSDRP